MSVENNNSSILNEIEEVEMIEESSSTLLDSITQQNDNEECTYFTADEPLALSSMFTIERMNSMNTGANLLEFLNSIPTGRTMYHRGLTFTRVLKSMKNLDLLHPSQQYENINSYGGLNSQQKNYFEGVIQSLNRRTDPENFQTVAESILGANRRVDFIPVADVEVGSVTVNRYALLCHAMVDPRLTPLWVNYNTSITAGNRHNALTEGISVSNNEHIDALISAIIDTVKSDVSNILKHEYNIFNNIHPEHGNFSRDVRHQFTSLVTQAKNNFDTLWYRLDKSGRNENGDILDATAMNFCKYGQRTVNVSHFYQYMLWKDQDLLFLSNRLPDTVGIECGFTPEENTTGRGLIARNRVSSSSSSSRQRSSSSDGSGTPSSSMATTNSSSREESSTGTTIGQQNSVLSRKDKKQIELQRYFSESLGRSIATVAQSTRKVHELSPGEKTLKRRKDESSIELFDAKKKLVDVERKAREAQSSLSQREVEIKMLQTAMNDASFNNLTAEQKQKVQNRYMELLITI